MKLEIGKFYKINRLAVGEKKFMYVGMTITDRSYTFYEFFGDKAVINGDFMLSINNIDCVEEWQEPEQVKSTNIDRAIKDLPPLETKEHTEYDYIIADSKPFKQLQQQIDELKTQNTKAFEWLNDIQLHLDSPPCTITQEELKELEKSAYTNKRMVEVESILKYLDNEIYSCKSGASNANAQFAYDHLMGSASAYESMKKWIISHFEIIPA